MEGLFLSKRNLRRLWNKLFKPECFGEWQIISMDCISRCEYIEECVAECSEEQKNEEENQKRS